MASRDDVGGAALNWALTGTDWARQHFYNQLDAFVLQKTVKAQLDTYDEMRNYRFKLRVEGFIVGVITCLTYLLLTA